MNEISIIVPVFNVELLLKRCINSIVTQTFKDFELILVDDGSPDGCTEICDESILNDERIIVLHKFNNGVSSARNAALEMLNSKYVTFIDSDDYIQKNWIDALHQCIVDYDADVVSGGYTLTDEYGNAVGKSGYIQLYRQIYQDEELTDHLISDIVCGKIGWEVWTRIFRTAIINNNHIRFCENCENYAEDAGFVLEYTLFCNKIVSITDRGYCYCVRNESMMHKTIGTIKINAVNEMLMQFYERINYGKFTEVKKIYPVIHYLMIFNEFKKYYNCIYNRKVLNSSRKTIRNSEWFDKYLFEIKSCYEKLCSIFGKEEALLIINKCELLRKKNVIKAIIVESIVSKKKRNFWKNKIIYRTLGDRNYYRLIFLKKMIIGWKNRCLK